MTGMKMIASGKVETDLVAIVGAACRLPGAANLQALENLLGAGGDAVGAVPAGRWTQAVFHSAVSDQRGKSYTFAAGCLDDVAGFDAEYFGISPREAVQMDPQQRLLLELALEALEDAGIVPSALAGQAIGVYTGGSASDYSTLRVGDVGVADAYFMTGISLCSLSNRISYAFDLRGPSLTVDTACSSSLVALDLACKALGRGEIDAALVGSASLLLAPHSFVGFSQASMLSKRGRCQAFDADADGYVRAEGGGMLMLKPLAAALKAGDEIHAVIRATEVNSDGRTTGLSRPSLAAQEKLLREIYRRAGVNAAELAYVEAHGTGTPIGDPIEAFALGEALGKSRDRLLPIGSVKTNLGHLEAASGMAGLFKLIVALRTGTVPASLHFKTPNPEIPFDALNLRVVSAPLKLPRSGRIVMGINSFGFGGTNAHAILESAPRAGTAPEGSAEQPPMLLLSAASPGALTALAREWEALIGDTAETLRLPALLRGAARHRETHAHQLAVIGSSATALSDAFAAHLDGRASNAVIEGTALREPGKLAFVFSGNGSQYPGMGRHAASTSAPFREALAEVDALLQPLLGWSVAARMLDEAEDWLGHTEIEQPMLFALQVASVNALQASGVTPQAVAGHSVGEVAAAWAAGALSLPDAARVIVERSRHQAVSGLDGGMAALGAEAMEAAEIIAPWPGLNIAAINARRSVTIAGPRGELAALGKRAGALGLGFTPLAIHHAFHSAAMDPVREPLLGALGELQPTVPCLPIASSVTGAFVEAASFGADYWWRNVRQPVRFSDALQCLIDSGVRVIVEIGPQPVLQSYIKDAFEAAEISGRGLASLTRRNQSTDPILATAARCHASGHSIASGPLFAGPAAWRGLPQYPWQKQQFWTERTEEATDNIFLSATHKLLGFRRNTGKPSWFNHLDLNAEPWLGDHKVDGVAVLPAAAILDMALAAAQDLFPDAAGIEILDVEIRRALVLEPDVTRQVDFHIETESGHFTLSSKPRFSTQAPVVHAAGRILASTSANTSRFPGLVFTPGEGVELGPEQVYRIASGHGLQYGPSFHAVAGIHVPRPDQAIVRLRPTGGSSAADRAVIDPALLDGAFQGLIALAPDAGERVTVLPVRFGRVCLLSRGAAPAKAEIIVTAIGPRSICADFLLYSENAAPLLELRDCWFSMLGAGQGIERPDHLIRPLRVPLPAHHTLLPAPPALPPLRAPQAEPQAGEHALLIEAFLSAAIYETLRDLFGIGTNLRAEISLLPGARPELLDQVMPWLEQDGLAIWQDQDWRLTDAEDFPGSQALFDAVFFEGSGDSAELALLAQSAAACCQVLRGQEMTQLPETLINQIFAAGRSAKVLQDRLRQEFGSIIAAWPADRPLRILEIDAGCPLTPMLLPLLRDLPAASYHVATRDSGRMPALEQALAGFHSFGLHLLDDEEDFAGSFDLVIGAFLFSRDREIGNRLNKALADGGILLLAEGVASRLWEAAGLLGVGLRAMPQTAEAWRDELPAEDYAKIEVEFIAAPVWPGCLVRAERRLSENPAPALETSVLICDAGDEQEAIPLPFRTALLYEIPAVRFGNIETILEQPELGRPACLVLLLQAMPADQLQAALPLALARIAQSICLLSGTGIPVWLAVRGDAAGDPVAEAIAGLRRVIANEMPDLRCRFILFDHSLDDAALATRLRHELSAADQEDEITWTQQARSGLRLLRGLPVRPRSGGNRLVIRRPGLIDTLEWTPNAPAGELGPDEVRVEVKASGLNFRDLMWSLGVLPDEALLGGFVGATLGLECAGTVSAVGQDVTSLKPGMRVMGFAPASFATHARASARAMVMIPDHFSDIQAATIPIAFMTAVYALGTLARLAPGERVLIHAAAGGVGLAAVQYARHCGAEIYATAGSPAKRAVLAALGVRHVFDSRSLSFVDDIMAATDGKGVDVVLNSLNGTAMERSISLLRPFGRFLELGKRDLYNDTRLGLRPFRNNISYFAIDVDKLPMQRPDVTETILREIGDLLQAGTLRPLPCHVFDSGEVSEAFRLMQSGSHLGKIVLRMGETPQQAAPPPSWSADPNGVYLLAGAAGGFGGEAAKYLVEHGARHLAIVSRRGESDPDAPEFREFCTAQGATVEFHAADISHEAELAAVLAEIRHKPVPLVGVLHAAAVLDDGLLHAMDASRFAKVMAPKLQGAMLLDRLTRDDPVRLFLLFSSIAALLGNPGQANYAAANAAIEAIAVRRRAQGLPGVALGWAPIADKGMLARNTALGEILTSVTGSRLLTAREALADLPRILAADIPLAVQAPMAFGGAQGMLPILRSAAFRQWRTKDEATPAEIHLPTLLAEMPPEEAANFLADILTEQIAQITRLPAARVNKDVFLGDVGMDSLMMIELRLTLEQRYGIAIPMLQLAAETTALTLARRLVQSLTASRQDGLTQEMLSRHEGVVLETAEDAAPQPSELSA